MSELAPEALVPDVWRYEAHPCAGCNHQWHSVPCDECACVTSCDGLVIIPAPSMPDLWWNDPKTPADCG